MGANDNYDDSPSLNLPGIAILVLCGIAIVVASL